jgi:hypothetical protein
MSRIENEADARALRAEELDAVNGGDSKPSRIKRFSTEMYVERMEFNIKEYDA